jgi:hypothetical protein
MNKGQVKKREDLLRLCSQYDVPFENVMDDKKLRARFHEHLKLNLNEEPFLFMAELDHFVTLIGTKARYKAACKIVTEYLELGAPKAINVSNKQREEARKQVNESTELSCSKDIFDALRLSVYTDLKRCLPTFLDSETFQNHVIEEMKTSENYLSTLGTIKDSYSSTMVTSEEATGSDECTTDVKISASSKKYLSDVYNPKLLSVHDSEFQSLTDEFNNQDMWKTVYNSDKRSVYVSKNVIYCGNKGIKKMLERSIFKCTPDELLYALIDEKYFTTIEKGLYDMEQKQYEKCGKYAGSVVYGRYKLPLMSKRDMVLIHSGKRNEDGSYLILKKSVELDTVPEQKGFIRMMCFGGYLIEKIDDVHTRMTVTFFGDLGGLIPAPIHNRLMALRDDSYYKAAMKAVQERRSLGLEEPSKSFGVLETIRYHESQKVM